MIILRLRTGTSRQHCTCHHFCGAWQSQEKYFAYGKDRDTANSVPTDHKFTGQKQDGSGLMYYGARFYDPQTGLFVSPDTIVADPGSVMSYNRTLYTLGNPIKYNDPSGHICVPVIQYGSTCGDPTLVDTAIELVVSVAAGDVNDVVTLVTGHDYVSGQDVGYFSTEWWVTGGLALLPMASGSAAKSTAKVAKKVDDALGTGVSKKIDDVIRQADCLINSFSAETLVMTARGLRPISKLVEGDLVLAWDEETGKTGYFVITDTISHVDPEIVLLTLDGETLETTAEHPFYVVEENEWSSYLTVGKWVDAGELQLGDDVLQADGSTGEVRSVQVVAQRQPMYNLTVDQAHTFFVGDGQWLVHNCKGVQVTKNWTKLSAGDSRCSSGCEAVAEQVQKLLGGDIYEITPAGGGRALGEFDDINTGWLSHQIVVKYGRVYDMFTGHQGQTLEEYMARWAYPDYLKLTKVK